MRRFVGTALFGLAVLCLAGCGGDGKLNRGGEVTGKVTIDGKPVTAGRVLFVSADGQESVPGRINGKGEYSVKEPPLGEVKIAVETQHMRNAPRPQQQPRGKGRGPANSSPGMVYPDSDETGMIYVPIPPKYERTETSGLTYTVAQGNTTHNLELTAKK